MVACFEKEYLRRPIIQDVKKMMELHEKSGSPVRLDPLTAKAGCFPKERLQIRGKNFGKDEKSEVMLETIGDNRLWIWSPKFGFQGSMNIIFFELFHSLS